MCCNGSATSSFFSVIFHSETIYFYSKTLCDSNHFINLCYITERKDVGKLGSLANQLTLNVEKSGQTSNKSTENVTRVKNFVREWCNCALKTAEGDK